MQREDGSERLEITLPGRDVRAKVWQARSGHVEALPARHRPAREQRARPRHRAPPLRRRPHDAHRAGDRARRGRRARARRDGHTPTVWHINEGHAAFLILERIREPDARGWHFDAALEAVAARTVFTSHTAVPAGHDQFVAAHDRALPGQLLRRVRRGHGEVAGARPPARRRRLQHDHPCHARLALPQRRLAHTRRRHLAHAEGHMAAGPQRGESGRLRHERRAYPDLSRDGVGRDLRPLPGHGLAAPAG